MRDNILSKLCGVTKMNYNSADVIIDFIHLFVCVFFRSGVMRWLFTPFELLAVIIHKYGPEKKSPALKQPRQDPGAH